MSESKPKPPRQQTEDVADLFRILRFMSSDVDVKEAHFRIAFRIAQFAHSGTSTAKVSDDTLMDHLPRTDGKKLRLFRRAIEASGWVRLVEGERGRPTRYVFLDARVPVIQKRLEDAAAKREAEFALERSRELSAMKSAALRARIDAETGEIQEVLRGEFDPLNQSSKGGNLCRDKGAILPPLLPQRSTYKTGYRQQDETPGARAPMPASARALSRLHPPPPPLEDELIEEFDGEALRDELLDQQLPRSESGQFMCVDCGTETELAARYKIEAYCPFCPECIETGEFPDVKTIPGPKSYAEASEGE